MPDGSLGQSDYSGASFKFVRIMFYPLSSSADTTDEPRSGLFESPPQGNTFFYEIDIVPFMECFCSSVVEFIVENCSSPIFHRVFERGDCEDYNYRNSAETRIRCAENRKYLELDIGVQGSIPVILR